MKKGTTVDAMTLAAPSIKNETQWQWIKHARPMYLINQ
jgi:hypothetical protein